VTDPAALLQLVFSGLTIGGIYALIALGLNIVFKATGAVSFVQGEWVVLGGMLAALLFTLTALPPLVLVVLVALAAAVLGAVSERLTVHLLRRLNATTITLLTIGMASVIRALVMLLLGKSPVGLPGFTGSGSLTILGATLQVQTLWVLGVMISIMVGVHLFFENSLTGRALRAVAADREAAALVGIRVPAMITWSFALAAVVGAVAGVIITPITTMSFSGGIFLGFKGFSAAMLGGLGSLSGALLGGVLLGLLEALAAGLISSEYKDLVAFVILLGILFVRPSGLLGREQILRV